VKRRSFLGTLAALALTRQLPMDEAPVARVVPNGGNIKAWVGTPLHTVDLNRDTIKAVLVDGAAT